MLCSRWQAAAGVPAVLLAWNKVWLAAARVASCRIRPCLTPWTARGRLVAPATEFSVTSLLVFAYVKTPDQHLLRAPIKTSSSSKSSPSTSKGSPCSATRHFRFPIAPGSGLCMWPFGGPALPQETAARYHKKLKCARAACHSVRPAKQTAVRTSCVGEHEGAACGYSHEGDDVVPSGTRDERSAAA